MRLINKADISVHKQISKSVKDITINQFVDDSQITDLLPLLGEKLYFDIQNNIANYTDLLNGVIYTYDGVSVEQPGLKKVLSLFVYARYIFHGTQTDTPFGYVEKQYQDGKQVNRINRKEIYTLNKQIAMQYWEQVRDYLNRESENYPLWNAECSNPKRKFRLNKISI